MKTNRTGFDMEYTFTHPSTRESENCSVDIPFDIFCEAIRQYSEIYCDVVLDGTDKNVWNLFARISGGLDSFYEDEDFINICKELYKDSYECEEDFEEWLDEYNFLHDIEEDE